MERITFTPNQSRASGRKVIAVLFAAFGGGLGALFFCAGLTTLALIGSEAWLMGLAFAGGGLFFGAVFLLFGFIFYRGSKRPELIQLDDMALVYTYGETKTVLRLAEITHLQGQWRPSQRHGHWAIVIRDRREQEIELDVPQGFYLATFDVLPILQALMPRLPSTVEVDQRVQGYLASGKMSAW